MPIDPFSVKCFSKLNPLRLGYVAYARYQERISHANFSGKALSLELLPSLEQIFFDRGSTAVTEVQMAHLIAAVRETEPLGSCAIVEIGSYRGETTRCLASATERRVFAVDPYIGYGGADEDYRRFKARTAGLSNVNHMKMTSGEAARDWSEGPISLVFIDAVHDYVNVRFDIAVWSDRLSAGGLIAIHDTDDPQFPGSRRAVFEAAKRLHVWAHPAGLALLRKSMSP